jgi:hypothetical protein
VVPETKGRSLEEIDEMFENRVSVRDFKSYVCLSSETAREIARKGHDVQTEVQEVEEPPSKELV